MTPELSSKSRACYPPSSPRLHRSEKADAAPPLTTSSLAQRFAPGLSARWGSPSAASTSDRTRSASASVEPAPFDDEDSYVHLRELSDAPTDGAYSRQRQASASMSSSASSDTSSDSDQSTVPVLQRPAGVRSPSYSARTSRVGTPSATGSSDDDAASAPSRATSPKASWPAHVPEVPAPSASLRQRHRIAGADSEGVLPLLPIASAPPAAEGMSTRHACLLVGGGVAATLGALGLAWGTQSLWQEPLVALGHSTQRQVGRHIVNPLASKLVDLAECLGRWGYQEPAAPAPYDLSAEWREIAGRMHRLGQNLGEARAAAAA